MTTYRARCRNETDRPGTMVIFQVLPGPVALDSVSWKEVTVAAGDTGGVCWDVTYSVALADYRVRGGRAVYDSFEIVPVELGTTWEVVWEGDRQRLKRRAHPAGAAQLQIDNRSGRIANPGVAVDGGGAVFKHGVLSGATALFEVRPIFWAAFYGRRLGPGEVIPSPPTSGPGPLRLSFPPASSEATITVTRCGPTLRLEVDYADRQSQCS